MQEKYGFIGWNHGNNIHFFPEAIVIDYALNKRKKLDSSMFNTLLSGKIPFSLSTQEAIEKNTMMPEILLLDKPSISEKMETINILTDYAIGACLHYKVKNKGLFGVTFQKAKISTGIAFWDPTTLQTMTFPKSILTSPKIKPLVDFMNSDNTPIKPIESLCFLSEKTKWKNIQLNYQRIEKLSAHKKLYCRQLWMSLLH